MRGFQVDNRSTYIGGGAELMQRTMKNVALQADERQRPGEIRGRSDVEYKQSSRFERSPDIEGFRAGYSTSGLAAR